MRLIKNGILVASAASLLALGACNADKNATTPAPASAPAPAPASTSPAVATVNGKAISQSSVDILARQGATAGHPDTPEARQTIIDRLALQMVVADEAIKKGLDKSPQVAEQIDSIRQSVLANAYVQDFIKNNPVTDDMLKAEYDRLKATLTGSEYKARHILVESEAEAREIIAKLKKEPRSFAKLAMDKSTDAASKVRGGDLGWFDLSRMVPEFGAAVSKLEKGKITEEPVKTNFGYHVIQLEDSRPIEVPPFEEVKPKLAQQIQQQNLKKQVEDLKAKAKIEMVAAPAAAAK